jgi:hypothetical protein
VAVPPRLPARDGAQEEGALSRLLIAQKIRISSELAKDFFSGAKIKFLIALPISSVTTIYLNSQFAPLL